MVLYSIRSKTYLYVLSAVLICWTANLPLSLLQGVAWTRMFVSFQEESSISVALERTFNGEEPCPMCCAIQEWNQAMPSDTLSVCTPSSPNHYVSLSKPVILFKPSFSIFGTPTEELSYTPLFYEVYRPPS